MLRFQGIVGIIVGNLSLCTTASGATNTTMLNRICDGQQYYPHGPYGNTVNAVLDDLSANTATHGYNYYGSFLNLYFQFWGHGACNNMLGQSDCTSCINSTRQQLFQVCSYSVGAQIQLQDCRVRYEIYSFTK
ncbi:hypothetical protein ACJRO7_026897 [Eucalyptus globulus]|uniref:Gnk2-homologous domain-containing protein n=1 Tax=Eucalyptus globulus TaxID=34317 RepID=A0ABD3JUE1_EUCGL